jgi:hypothetical protein
VGTRDASGAVLRREAGAVAHGTRVGPGAALSQWHAAPSELICVERWVLPPELPRAGLLLVVFGDFFLVASSCLTPSTGGF